MSTHDSFCSETQTTRTFKGNILWTRARFSRLDTRRGNTWGSSAQTQVAFFNRQKGFLTEKLISPIRYVSSPAQMSEKKGLGRNVVCSDSILLSNIILTPPSGLPPHSSSYCTSGPRQTKISRLWMSPHHSALWTSHLPPQFVAELWAGLVTAVLLSCWWH